MFNNDDDKKRDDNIEIVIGDESVLDISEVNDYSEGLKPSTEKKSRIVIPTERKKIVRHDDKKENNEKKDENKDNKENKEEKNTDKKDN